MPDQNRLWKTAALLRGYETNQSFGLSSVLLEFIFGYPVLNIRHAGLNATDQGRNVLREHKQSVLLEQRTSNPHESQTKIDRCLMTYAQSTAKGHNLLEQCQKRNGCCFCLRGWYKSWGNEATKKSHCRTNVLRRQTFRAFQCLVQDMATEDLPRGATRMMGNMTSCNWPIRKLVCPFLNNDVQRMQNSGVSSGVARASLSKLPG